jgi:hypothetical protein
VLLLFLVLIVGRRVWLANAMFDQRALDESAWRRAAAQLRAGAIDAPAARDGRYSQADRGQRGE